MVIVMDSSSARGLLGVALWFSFMVANKLLCLALFSLVYIFTLRVNLIDVCCFMDSPCVIFNPIWPQSGSKFLV